MEIDDDDDDDDFLSNIRQATPKMIEDQASRYFKVRDLDGLKRLFTAVDADNNKMEYGKEREARSRALGAVQRDMERLKEEQAKANEDVIGRVAGITVGLDENLKHRIDLHAFSSRVDGLFQWHNDKKERSEYMAPYFTVIQSSGTGKTRLFKEFRNNTSAKTDYDCKTVLCSFQDGIPDPGSDRFFDAFLFLQQSDGNPDKHREIKKIIAEALYLLVKNSTKDKLVLLFDEAQSLVGLDGFGFRRVRWWLRQKREKQIVAVFAGTTSKLANIYEDVVTTRISRDTDTEYVNYRENSPNNNPSKIYDPFFRICTMGCYRNESPPLTSAVDVSDLQRAAYFGRPLFAYLAKQETLVRNDDVSVTNSGAVIISNVKLHAILSRMLTSHTNGWRDSQAALCSILGSRVQMGIMTSCVDMASELVSKAYAHLVDIHHDNNITVLRISFMPDPVCAALAMGMMNKDWTLANGNVYANLTGENAKFWSKQAMVLLKSGLCLPEKDDSGEILAALYMLFCGDLLRFAKDKSLRTFSVPLVDWYAAMRGDSYHHSEPKATVKGRHGESNNASTTNCKLHMEVNFIQVCRNYFRGHSWKTQKALESMYNAATAIYVYPDCEAIDLVVAVRVLMNGKTSYHPMLVSVKCWMPMSQARIDEAMNNMQALLHEIRSKNGNVRQAQTKTLAVAPPVSECPPALGLLVLLGAQHDDEATTSPLKLQDFVSPELGNFPYEDAFRMISVPADDSFGISAALHGMTTVHEMAEVFSSHAFVYGEDGDNEEHPSQILCTKSVLHVVTEFVDRLFSIIPK